MEINEVKIGDVVSYKNKKGKMMKGTVIHRHEDKGNLALMGMVNVKPLDDESYPETVHVSTIKKAIKEETNMEHIREAIDELIGHVESGNHIEAEKIFQSLLQDKVDDLLDAAKVEVASSMFNTQECAECSEEVDEEELEEGNAMNKAKKNAYVTKVGSQVKKFREPTNKTTGRAVMRPQPNDSKIDSRDYQKSGKDAFWKKKGVGTGVHKEEVEEAVVIKPTPAVQAAIDAYKKKKAASSATHDGKTNQVPAVRTMKKEEVEQTDEALKGGQHKIDANKNGKLDAHDFKLLRGIRGRKTAASERMDRALAKRVEDNKMFGRSRKSMKVK